MSRGLYIIFSEWFVCELFVYSGTKMRLKANYLFVRYTIRLKNTDILVWLCCLKKTGTLKPLLLSTISIYPK